MSQELIDAIEDDDAQRVRDAVASLREGHAKFAIDRLMGNLRTPMQWAIETKADGVAIALLDLGANPNASFSEKEGTLLCRLLEREIHEWEPIDLARKLIDGGINVRLPFGEKQQTALHIAAKSNAPKIARLIIDAGGLLEEKDKNGCTPLSTAAFYGWTDVTRILLEEGSDTNSRNERGNTPLHRACLRGNYNTAEKLIRAGADVQAISEEGNTPLQICDPFDKHEGNLSRLVLIAYGADTGMISAKSLDDMQASTLRIPDRPTMRQAAILCGRSQRLMELLSGQKPEKAGDEPPHLIDFCRERGLEDMRAVVEADMARRAIDAISHTGPHGSRSAP